MAEKCRICTEFRETVLIKIVVEFNTLYTFQTCTEAEVQTKATSLATNATTKMATTAATDDQRLPFLVTAHALTFVNAFVELFILVVLITCGVRKKKLRASWSSHLLICISMPLIHLMNIAVTKT